MRDAFVGRQREHSPTGWAPTALLPANIGPRDACITIVANAHHGLRHASFVRVVQALLQAGTPMSAPAATIAPELQRYAELDKRLLAAVRGIQILPTVAWPASLENRPAA